jgi:hypothetical protein
MFKDDEDGLIPHNHQTEIDEAAKVLAKHFADIFAETVKKVIAGKRIEKICWESICKNRGMQSLDKMIPKREGV